MSICRTSVGYARGRVLCAFRGTNGAQIYMTLLFVVLYMHKAVVGYNDMFYAFCKRISDRSKISIDAVLIVISHQ